MDQYIYITVCLNGRKRTDEDYKTSAKDHAHHISCILGKHYLGGA